MSPRQRLPRVIPALVGALACAAPLVAQGAAPVVAPAPHESTPAVAHDVLAPELDATLADAAPDALVDVYLVMADALGGRELERRVDGLDGRARKQAVATELRAHAAATQVGVRAVLDAAVEAGRAELVSVLWMGNALILRAQPGVLEALAEVPGVDRIRALPDTPAERAQDVLPPAPAAAPATARPLPVAPALGAAAPYPFEDDFESGVLQPWWTVATTGGGYVDVSDTNGPVGVWHAVMASNMSSVDSTASITVELDLAGQTDVGIRFRHKEFGDENHPEDGVFVSTDGVVWHEVVSLQNGGKEYAWKWVTLDPLLPGFGITFTSSFLVRFQWRDNFDIPSDGFAFDDIEIGPGVGVEPPPEVEPHIPALKGSHVWANGFLGDGVLIGTIDSGTNWEHPDLVDRVWTNPGEIDGNGLDDDGNGFVDDIHGWDFEFGGPDVKSTDPHGTSTAGLMVGDGSAGRITGMAPGASLVVTEVQSESDYWQAQQYLLDVGVDVVSSSYSYKWPDRPDYHFFRQLCDVELAAGIVHANSIGNQGGLQATHPIPFNISTPANCPSPFAHPALAPGGRSSILACGGIQMPDDSLYNPSGRGPSAWEDLDLYDPARAWVQDPAYWDYPYGGFGGSGPGLIKPDVVTYTNSVMTTSLTGGYTLFSGTSAATPQLGGALALLLDVQPHALPRHLAGALTLTAKDLGAPGRDDQFGAGKIQVLDAARRLVTMCRFTPTEASPGQPFDIEVFGLPNDTVYGFYQASLVTTTGDLNLPFPLFFLGLRFTDAQGEAAWNLAVPNDPGLVGLTVWLQVASEANDGSWGAGPFFSVPDSLTVVP